MNASVPQVLNPTRGRKSSTPSAGRALSAAVLGIFLCCALGARAANAQVEQNGRVPAEARGQEAEAQATLPDVTVLNQDGEKIRFYSDLIKGKAFVISFVFTTCTYICPMQGESLSRIQDVIGERLGKEVNLIAVSVDPEKDTPARLKAWGAQFGAKPGWTLVTGEKSEIDKLARALTGAPVAKGEHAPVVFIGGDGKGEWVRAYGLSGPATFARLIEEATR